VLDRLHTLDPHWLEKAVQKKEYPPICTLAWSGDGTSAAALLARWEESWRREVAYAWGTGDLDLGTLFARALACTGRNDEAVMELERLVAEGYHADGWRWLVVDHAFDGIRDDPRFQALAERLRAVAEGEHQRFLERPDLQDADIDALAPESNR
jgi:hypothetical protein